VGEKEREREREREREGEERNQDNNEELLRNTRDTLRKRWRIMLKKREREKLNNKRELLAVLTGEIFRESFYGMRNVTEELSKLKSYFRKIMFFFSI